MKVINVDIEKCTGCRTGETACSIMNTGASNPTRSRVRVIRYERRGEFHNFIPMVCQQCRDPFCADACIMGAITRNDQTGALIVNENLCVGCKTCVVACPLGGVLYHWIKECSMKCDLCDGDPQCVKACLYGALEFLSMDEWGRKKRLKGAENLGRLYEIIYK